ncbi:unnamed protein product, partial [Mesorhabditis spiculigera]
MSHLRTFIAIAVAYVLAIHVEFVLAQTCPTSGFPGLVLCDTASKKCLQDPSLGCETVEDGSLYCCPMPETTAKPTTAKPTTKAATTLGLCQDQATYCTSQSALCTSNLAEYRSLMATQCPVTCKQCGNRPIGANAATTVSGCADVLATCATNKGLCKNANYSLIMPIKCKKTCGLC